MVGTSWDTGCRSQYPGALGRDVGINLLISQVEKRRPREGWESPRSQRQWESSYRRRGVSDTLWVGEVGWPRSCRRRDPSPPRPWLPCPHPGAEFSFSPAHPRMPQGSNRSGAGSGWAGSDFGWRGWQEGVVSRGGAVWRPGPDHGSLGATLFLSHPTASASLEA